jgi:hypothetical protein
MQGGINSKNGCLLPRNQSWSLFVASILELLFTSFLGWVRLFIDQMVTGKGI